MASSSASLFREVVLRPFAIREESVRHAGENDRDVVAPAVLVGELDQLRRGDFQRRALLVDDAVHDVGVHHVGEPVRAQQVDVVGFDAILGDVGGDDRLDAERARHEVLVERKPRLVRR